jgi:hypothetical protein
MLYSKSTNGFYDAAIHKPDQIPGDAVTISGADYRALLAGQEQGRIIAPGAGVRPVLADRGPSPPPESVTPRQFWMQIEIEGATQTVEAIIAGLEDPLQRIHATRAQEYRRDDALLVQLAQASMGKTSEQIDEFFIAAGRL